MPDLPARINPVFADPPTHRERQVVAARRKVENAIVGHELESHYRTQVALTDVRAAGEVSTSALECEIEFYTKALEKAGNSGALAALIARHLQDLQAANRRIFQEAFR